MEWREEKIDNYTNRMGRDDRSAAVEPLERREETRCIK